MSTALATVTATTKALDTVPLRLVDRKSLCGEAPALIRYLPPT